jgi:hypothetical protein
LATRAAKWPHRQTEQETKSRAGLHHRNGLVLIMAGPKNKRRKIAKKQKRISVVFFRGCLTVFAELAGIAGFLLALYLFWKGM